MATIFKNGDLVFIKKNSMVIPDNTHYAIVLRAWQTNDGINTELAVITSDKLLKQHQRIATGYFSTASKLELMYRDD